MKSFPLTTVMLLAGFAADASCLDSLAAHRAQNEADSLKSKDSSFDAAMRARFAGFSFRFQLGGATQARTAYQRMDLPAAGEKAYAGKH
jgi:hypothetical protein